MTIKQVVTRGFIGADSSVYYVPTLGFGEIGVEQQPSEGWTADTRYTTWTSADRKTSWTSGDR